MYTQPNIISIDGVKAFITGIANLISSRITDANWRRSHTTACGLGCLRSAGERLYLISWQRPESSGTKSPRRLLCFESIDAIHGKVFREHNQHFLVLLIWVEERMTSLSGGKPFSSCALPARNRYPLAYHLVLHAWSRRHIGTQPSESDIQRRGSEIDLFLVQETSTQKGFISVSAGDTLSVHGLA